MFFSRHFRRLSTRSLSPKDESSLSYCREQVEKYEKLHRLVYSLVPDASVRDAILVVRALNIEAALVQDKVADASFGEMRIAFWKDGVRDALRGSPPAHPLLRAVSVMAEELSPHRARLISLVGCRERHLREDIESKGNNNNSHGRSDGNNNQGLTLETMEKRAEETQGAVLHAGLAIMKNALDAMGADTPWDAHSLSHCASHVARAEGIALAMRAVGPQAALGKCIVPVDIAAAAEEKVAAEAGERSGLESDEPADRVPLSLSRGQASPAVRESLLGMGTVAMQHLAAARDQQHTGKHGKIDRKIDSESDGKSKRLPLEALVVMAPSAAWAEVYLRAVEKADFDPFDLTPVNESGSGWRGPAQALKLFWNGGL